MKPQIPWLRVFIEGVVIVGSILAPQPVLAQRGARRFERPAPRLSVALLAEGESRCPARTGDQVNL